MTTGEISSIWKEEIESINIRGYSRKVKSVDFFQMFRFYTNEDKFGDCWKVNFIFLDGFTSNPCREVYLDNRLLEWSNNLEQTFISKFGDIKDKSGGYFKFENHICDYFQNQGYRFIIQFYLPGYISKIREDKLNQLIN